MIPVTLLRAIYGSTVLRCAAGVATLLCFASAAYAEGLSLSEGALHFSASSENFRYQFDWHGHTVVPADAHAGLTIGGSPVTLVPAGSCDTARCLLSGTSASGERVLLRVELGPQDAVMTLTGQHPGEQVRFVTAGAAPAYGLADHAVETEFSTLPDKQFNTNVTGFADNSFFSGQGITRLVSNFVIYPKQQFAELLIDPYQKIVHTSQTQIVQGVVHAHGKVTLHYFFGNPHQIYAAYLQARRAAGYEVLVPKWEAFGVGWEAFGALGWDTNQKTVLASVDRYRALGYPIRWVVIGSGFWPAEPPSMHATTSFGLWDRSKYPDPRGMIDHFHREGIKVLLGLRITFITTGPYSAEGAAKGYFLEKDGKPEVFIGSWPKLPYYLLDAHNPAALRWYMKLVKRWQDYGIDGFKEDFYGYGRYVLRDDKVDPVNNRLMAERQFVIERNGYLSSNGDLHRINDFNYDQDQDRGPVNALALAYSGFPLVYPDIVGGTFGEDHFDTVRTARMQIYMMRNAQWAALHSSMGMGEPPWTFSRETARVMLEAAKLHARIAPYIYSYARRFAEDGYPWTMTPLPIAFPDDPRVYGRENATDRAYEWLIGDAILATPLYGNDYATAGSRNIFLPSGHWMDFDTGVLYPGNTMLKHFALPPGKTPIFIGGSGITLEQTDHRILVHVYPVGQHASGEFVLPDGNEPFTVDVRMPAAGQACSGVRVVNRHGDLVPAIKSGFSYAFLPRPGERYTVIAR